MSYLPEERILTQHFFDVLLITTSVWTGPFLNRPGLELTTCACGTKTESRSFSLQGAWTDTLSWLASKILQIWALGLKCLWISSEAVTWVVLTGMSLKVTATLVYVQSQISQWSYQPYKEHPAAPSMTPRKVHVSQDRCQRSSHKSEWARPPEWRWALVIRSLHRTQNDPGLSRKCPLFWLMKNFPVATYKLLKCMWSDQNSEMSKTKCRKQAD